MALDHLLALSARVNFDPAHAERLAQQAILISDWSAVPTQAEAQGLGPLLYWQLKAAAIPVPTAVRRELQALYLRHRHANGVRIQVLVDILQAFQAAAMQVRVLKGAALAPLIYPEPALRPMRDLDLLVRSADLSRAQTILSELGFNIPRPFSAGRPVEKHLEAAARQVDGLQVSVELHHNLFSTFERVSLTMEQLTGEPVPVSLPGFVGQALSGEDMVWHLAQHIAYHASIWEPIRLIWVADLVGLAERLVGQIDWDDVARRYPLVLKMLSLFHFVTPLSAELRQQAGIKIGRPPQSIGREFEGWPRLSLAGQRHKSWTRILSDTFFPSEWWLRLHYRLDSRQSLFWYRWLRHPLYILGPFYLVEKLKLFWYLKLQPRLRSQ